MSQPNNRRRDPGGVGSEAILVWIVIIVVAIVVGGAYATVHLGHRLAGTGEVIPSNPFDVFFGLLKGDVTWPGTTGTWVASGLGVALLVIVIGIWVMVRKIRGKGSRVDRAAAFLRVKDSTSRPRPMYAAARSTRLPFPRILRTSNQTPITTTSRATPKPLATHVPVVPGQVTSPLSRPKNTSNGFDGMTSPVPASRCPRWTVA